MLLCLEYHKLYTMDAFVHEKIEYDRFLTRVSVGFMHYGFAGCKCAVRVYLLAV